MKKRTGSNNESKIKVEKNKNNIKDINNNKSSNDSNNIFNDNSNKNNHNNNNNNKKLIITNNLLNKFINKFLYICKIFYVLKIHIL